MLASDLESGILRALCNESPALDPSDAQYARTRAAILASLRAHRWQDPEHRVVFEALCLLPGRSAAELREQLPAQATRMGFPDVDWNAYFASGRDDSPIESLLAELLAVSPDDER